jgi:hypothetical protein
MARTLRWLPASLFSITHLPNRLDRPECPEKIEMMN